MTNFDVKSFSIISNNRENTPLPELFLLDKIS